MFDSATLPGYHYPTLKKCEWRGAVMTGMPIAEPVRTAVERAMRETRRSVRHIAEETGVSSATIRSWNRRYGWRPPVAGSNGVDPARWNAPRRAAVARLYAQPSLDIGDLALAMGARPRQAEVLFARCGLEGRRAGAVAEATGPDSDPRRLRAALRAHIARQIMRFDAALNAEDDAGGPKTDTKTFDSARVLRDLGGLKRLLDEADQDARTRGAEHGAGLGQDIGQELGQELAQDLGEASRSAGTAHDLPALRAQIALRLDALCDERPVAGCPGEPAPAPDPGAGD